MAVGILFRQLFYSKKRPFSMYLPFWYSLSVPYYFILMLFPDMLMRSCDDSFLCSSQKKETIATEAAMAMYKPDSSYSKIIYKYRFSFYIFILYI